MLALLLLALGCDEPAPFEATTPRQQEPTDRAAPAPAASTGTYRWVDADGRPVTDGPWLQAFDADGHLWSLDVETGSVVALPLTFTGHTDPDCASEPHTLYPRAPRIVVGLDGDPATRRDATESVCVGYVRSGSTCSATPACIPALPRSAYRLVTTPSPPGGAPPLRPVPL